MATYQYYAPKYYDKSGDSGYPSITGTSSSGSKGTAYFRIGFDLSLNKTGRICTVTATLQMVSTTTWGEWTGTLHGISWKKSTSSKASSLEDWTDMASTSWKVNVGDDGSYTVDVKGSLIGPSGTSLSGKSKSTSRSITKYDGTPTTITITYKWSTESGTQTALETQKRNTSFYLRTAPSSYSIEGDTYKCTINGGEGAYSGDTLRESTQSTKYTFKNWVSSGGASYNAEASISLSSDETFSATYSSEINYSEFTWPYKSDFSHDSKSETFTITGDGNGGTNKASNATKTIPYDISSSLTSNFGYTYYYGDTDHLTKDEDGNTVYPTWTEGTPKYANNTIGNLGSTSRDDATKIGYIISFEGLSSQVNQDLSCSYTFDGWYDSIDGGNKYDDSASFTEATTVYAHWNETKKPNAVQLPDPTARPGYEFLGWMTSEGKILTGDDFANMLPTVEGEGITLTASWKAKGLARIYVGGEYKQALCYVYHEGQYHQAMPYIYTDGKYRLGG